MIKRQDLSDISRLKRKYLQNPNLHTGGCTSASLIQCIWSRQLICILLSVVAFECFLKFGGCKKTTSSTHGMYVVSFLDYMYRLYGCRHLTLSANLLI